MATNDPKDDLDDESRLLAADPKTLSEVEWLARRRVQGRERARRCRARKAGLDAPELQRPRLPGLTPEERLARRRAQGRERGRLARERERSKSASSPEKKEELRAKWRAQAKRAYSREVDRRAISPEVAEKFRATWRARAKRQVALEIAGRAADAPEHLRTLAEKKREYRRKHKAKKYTDDLAHRLSVVLRSRLRSAVRNGQKRGSAIRDLGCTVDELKAHLERLFEPGMTWESFGQGEGRWCIDHTFPMKWADLNDRAHVLAVCNWRNLRPMWFAENVRKSARVSPKARAMFDQLVEHFRGGGT